MPSTIHERKNRKAPARNGDTFSRLRTIHWATWLLLGVVVFFCIVRWRLRDLALERDEGEYAYSGQLMLQGIPPYQLAYNMKLPGTYAAYALIMAVFGESSSGIHTGLLLMSAATALLIFLIGRKLFGTVAGAFAGMCYALASISHVVLGLAGHATNFVVLWAAAGILLLLRAIDEDSLPLFLGCGTCLGLAFLMKQPGIVFSVFALAYLAYKKREHLREWNYGLSRFGALLAGIIWPFVLTCLVLYASGVFRNFWFWSFSYARAYGSEISFIEGFGLLQRAVLSILWQGGAVWVLAGLGLIALLWKHGRRDRVFVVGLLLFSVVGVSTGFYFRSHYFVLLLPAVSLLAGLAIASTIDITERLTSVRSTGALVPLIVFAIAFAVSLAQEAPTIFAPSPVVASNRLYPADNPFLAAREVSKYIESVSSPESRLAVFGSEPEIYFYSHRHSATGYVYTYGLMEDQRYASHMQQEMIQEVDRAKPEFVVFVDDELSWLWERGGSPELFFDWIQTYINGQYTKVAQVDIGGTAGHLLGNTPRIYVFRRKA